MLRDGIRDWDRIKDLLPGRIGHVGATARNNRLFIDAVLYRIRTGIPWRDLPERFGDFKNIHRRFSRWAEKGLWTNLFGPGDRSLARRSDNSCSGRCVGGGF